MIFVDFYSSIFHIALGYIIYRIFYNYKIIYYFDKLSISKNFLYPIILTNLFLIFFFIKYLQINTKIIFLLFILIFLYLDVSLLLKKKKIKIPTYFIISICIVIINSALLHDPTNTINFNATIDSFFYINTINSNFVNLYYLNDQSLYGLVQKVSQNFGSIIAYPFKDIEFFKPFLFFSISLNLFILLSIGNLTKYSTKHNSLVIILICFLFYFTPRYEFYLNESLPTILSFPIIYSLGYMISKEYQTKSILSFSIIFFCIIISIILSKLALLAIALPLMTICLLNQKIIKKNFIIKTLFFFGIIISISLIFYSRRYDILDLTTGFQINYFNNDYLFTNINNYGQIVLMIAFLLLFYKSFQFLLILIICFIFANVGAGGPMYIYLFLLIVFNLSHNLNYKLINFKSYKYLDEVIISLIFITCVYLFIKFHLTIGLYFLFGCFFISLLIDIRKRKLLYILILIFSMTFPALMYKKKPYQQEWADIKSLFTLAKEIKYLTQKDSLIFTDISKDFTLYSKQKAFVNDQRLLNYNDPWVNYLTSSDRQFYFLSGYLLRFEDKNKYDRRNMVKFNNKVIYDLIDKELLKSRFKNENFYILIKSENIEKIDNSNKQLIYEDNKYSFFKLI